MLCSGDIDHENAYRNPAVVWNITVQYNWSHLAHARTITGIFPEYTWGVDNGKNRPMTEIDAETEIMMQLPEQLLELGRVLKEENRNFIYLFLLK